MIKLTKVAEPDVLKKNGAAWLKVIEDRLVAGQKPTESEKGRYRHDEIKAALRLETHGKCAYCESRLLHIALGDVEHVVPKSSDIKQTFRWENLTLACDVCNTAKGTSENIADPYTEDPQGMFKFIGPMIFPVSNNDKAVNTERKLKLNRKELLERRSERLKAISDQLLLIARVQDPDLKNTLKLDLEHAETRADTEFAAFARSFISVMLPSTT